MPWGVPTGRLANVLDPSPTTGDFMPDQRPDFAGVPQLGIMGAAQPMGIDAAMTAALKPAPKHNWMGILADALSGAAGMPGMYGQRVAQQKQMEAQRQLQMGQLQLQNQMQEQTYQRHRADSNADWIAHQKYTTENSTTPTEDEYDFRTKTQGKAAADAWLASKGDPPVTITLPGGRIYSGPRSGLGTALSGTTLPIRPVGKITPIQGGPASAPGTFPEAAGSGSGRGGGLSSFKSSAYDSLEAPIEQELGIPSGLMRSIRTRGEMSNANQVSPAGAQTVYQVIPATRAGVIRNYGVDAYSDPASAARAAALVLKENYTRTGSWLRAVQQYHGGLDPSNYGPINRAYVSRVAGGL